MGESNIVIFSPKGNDLPLAESIASRLSVSLGEMGCGTFENKETKMFVGTSVRNKDAYVLQVMKDDPNDSIMELLMACYALKTACCRKVIGIIPYLPYSKQSKMRNRGSIPAKLLADLLCRAGLDHMLTMDLHSKEVQGFYDCPVDNLRASPFLIQYIQDRISGYTDAVIVARHPGSAARANAFAERLQLNIAVLHGEHNQEDSEQCDGRQSPPVPRRRNRGYSESASNEILVSLDSVRSFERQSSNQGLYNTVLPPLGLPTKIKKPLSIVGDVAGKICIIVEDIVDDATVLVQAAKILRNGGAIRIYAVATHGLFSGDACSIINDSHIDEVIVTNTIPVEQKMKQCPKIKSVDISPLLSEAVRRIHNGESMSYLFRNIALED